MIKHKSAKAIVAAIVSLAIVAAQTIQTILSEHPHWTSADTVTVILAVLAPALVYLQPNAPAPAP